VTFMIYISSPAVDGKRHNPRGPVSRDFGQKSICALVKGRDEWNFTQAVDKETDAFVVILEVLSGEVPSTR